MELDQDEVATQPAGEVNRGAKRRGEEPDRQLNEMLLQHELSPMLGTDAPAWAMALSQGIVTRLDSANQRLDSLVATTAEMGHRMAELERKQLDEGAHLQILQEKFAALTQEVRSGAGSGHGKQNAVPTADPCSSYQGARVPPLRSLTADSGSRQISPISYWGAAS